MKVRNIDMTEGVELTSRYMASQESGSTATYSTRCCMLPKA